MRYTYCIFILCLLISPCKSEILDLCAKGVIFQEVNGGNLHDEELVLAVLIRRIDYYKRRNPHSTDYQILKNVLGTWYPNTYNRVMHLQKTLPANYAKVAINNAKAREFTTYTGQFAWNNKVTDFAHTPQPPLYYSKLKHWHITTTKFPVYCASSSGYFK